MGRFFQSHLSKKAEKKENKENFSFNPYMSLPENKINDTIINRQIEILNDAIKKYERLEDIKKFTSTLLYEMENVTEEDILRAVELEEKLKDEKEIEIKKLLHSDEFLNDIFNEDFK